MEHPWTQQEDTGILVSSEATVMSVYFRCEVSAEAPLFNTVAQSKRLSVIALPGSPPIISGLRKIYQLNQLVTANCTSGSSFPAPALSWLVNKKKASTNHLINYPIIQHKSGLQTAVLGIQFLLSKPSTAGSLEMMCSSSMQARVSMTRTMQAACCIAATVHVAAVSNISGGCTTSFTWVIVWVALIILGPSFSLVCAT